MHTLEQMQYAHIRTCLDKERKREREGERGRQTDRQTETEKDRDGHRERERELQIQRRRGERDIHLLDSTYHFSLLPHKNRYLNK